MNFDSEQIQGNVNTQEIAGETLLSPDPVDDSVYLLADSKDPFVDFGELAHDVVWIDSEGFSTINDVDWNLLGGQKKQPDALTQ
ncbi:unnamed protein product [Orchesella dallaii]|uniref:Uncharacterized protein n=1 Tax=Orchesella dallaii TaxID=48710 RepID=A0ABP1S2N9_9HEXA